MDAFIHSGMPARVVFGSGTLGEVGAELERLGVSRALILATPHQVDAAEALRARVGARAVAVFAEAAMHTPVEVTERAMKVVAGEEIDGTVALGGGSTIGLGKAIALRTDVPQIAIPTTYAGSEMTPILGETEGGRKTTQRSPKVLPETVIYDVDLTLTLPVGLSVTSGMNAIAHAAEGLYARDRNPLVSLMAREAIRALSGALIRIVRDPQDRAARSDASYGAWLAGTVLGGVGMALHHKLCHTLGGSFNLPHAETHSVILPHAIAFNALAAGPALAPIAEILGAPTAGEGLFDLARELGAPTDLKGLGMPEDGIAAAARLATQAPYWNPRPFQEADIVAILRGAWEGRRPVG